VADADEALGEDVEEEAAKELLDGELQELDPISVRVVAVTQCDAVSLHAEDPAVRTRRKNKRLVPALCRPVSSVLSISPGDSLPSNGGDFKRAGGRRE
jgi:hypothetical protein